MTKTSVRVTVCAGLFAISGVTSAVPYVWDLNASDPNPLRHIMTFTDGAGHSLDVYAYRSKSTCSTLSSCSTNAADDNNINFGAGNLIEAYVNPDGSSGLGVSSLGEASDPKNPGTNEDARLIDNRDGVEVLVFDSKSANFDWNTLDLGFIKTGSGVDDTPSVQYWTGNGTGALGNTSSTQDQIDLAFKSLCLTSGTNGYSCTTLAASNFTKHPQLNNLTTAPQTLASNAQGRYLVVSGALDASYASTGFDKFKIKTVPVPHTLALFGIGVLAMVGFRRRKLTLN